MKFKKRITRRIKRKRLWLALVLTIIASSLFTSACTIIVKGRSSIPNPNPISDLSNGNEKPKAAAIATCEASATANANNKEDFISIWKTDNEGASLDTQLELALVENGNYDFTVDWGDGSISQITAYDSDSDNDGNLDRTHTYAKADKYLVAITGTIEGWRFAAGTLDRSWRKDPDTRDAKKLTEVCQWGSFALGRVEDGHFAGISNLKITSAGAPDLSKTSSISYAFTESEFDQDISSWDTSEIKDFEGTFADSTYNSPLNWDVSAGTNFIFMFKNNHIFNQDISGWNTSNAAFFDFMFSSADAFNQNISGWDVSNATRFIAMFADTRSFNQNISGWDVANATNFVSMFFRAEAFQPDFYGNASNWKKWIDRFEEYGVHCSNIFRDTAYDTAFEDFFIANSSSQGQGKEKDGNEEDDSEEDDSEEDDRTKC